MISDLNPIKDANTSDSLLSQINNVLRELSVLAGIMHEFDSNPNGVVSGNVRGETGFYVSGVVVYDCIFLTGTIWSISIRSET